MKAAISLLFCVFVLCLPRGFATHIVGGEITWRCVGNNIYEINLTVYRDCYNGQVPFDDPAIVGIYANGPDTLFAKLEIPYNPASNDTLPVVLDDPCLVAPPNICVHRTVYRAFTPLPYRDGGYTIVYQRCCRNILIRNIPDPINTGITYVAEISGEALLGCNSSAVFKYWPPVAICVHHPIHFDHSATDADGDSLRYRLCTPFSGPDSLHSLPDPPPPPPYPEIIWVDPPYNLMNLLGGDPLKIDSITGLISGIPNTIGNFVVGVCVDEYRQGALISTTRRDFQYNVADCGKATAAFFVPETICDTLAVSFSNQSHYAHNYRWYFDWPGNLSASSTEESPIYTYPDIGDYVVALVAEPNGLCSDTFLFTLHLVSTGAVLTAQADPAEIRRGDESQLFADFPGAVSYSWEPTASLSDSAIFNPIARPEETTTYTVISTLPNGCQKSGAVEVRVIPPGCAPPYVFFPTGFSPNGDGENDFLKLESKITVEVYWVIYDRWGNRVFVANSINDAWDGTYKGSPLPAETYGYYLRVRCEDGSEYFRKGNVTLIR